MKNNKSNPAQRLQHISNPSELMRARHPDLFSDTRIDKVSRLPKAVFEYHLETLTSRKQEYEFEHFCRKLAEKEICPNLRVQTGPTGGGDSKVDTETYPVAAEIAERWWIGEPSAGAERWAFAFSAKKDWKPKIKADVSSILSTSRDYKRIYFFTNQFASDKDRAKQEDTLSSLAGIPVHIIDRAWIVETVYDNDHLDLAISTLGIEGAGSENQRRPGPRDVARLIELEELDKQVADPTRYQGARYQLVEDCLRSAILARELERPRHEVESRFIQADRLAQQLDFCQQRMRIAYNQAWTTHWWYEDYPAFNRFYNEVEHHLAGSTQATDVERLLNLWQLLIPAAAKGWIKAEDAYIEPRRERLVAMLQNIAADSSRPNNAMQARTGLTLIKALQAMQTGTANQLNSVWAELSQIVDESTALGAYPVEQLSDLIQEIGKHIDSPEFDSLYEKIVDVIRLRRSEGAAGEAYCERGLQKLQQGKPYEAIQWLGRAEELLVKEECRADLVWALACSSYAYEQVGLIWAARNKILAAVERSLAAFQHDGEIFLPALRSLQRLVWVELQLGRIPHVLNAMAIAGVIAPHLKLSEEHLATYNEEMMMQEAVLGIHLLNIPFEVLPTVSHLPDALERIGLTNARLILLFALGHEKVIYDEQYFPPDESMEKLQVFFERWQDQPAAKDITPYPVLVEGSTSLLRTIILGSEIVLITPNNPTSFGIAESLLGALEAFLATSDEADLIPHREVTTILVCASASVTGAPKIHFSDKDCARIEIVHPVDLGFSTAEDILAFRDWLQEAVVGILCRIFVIRDVQIWMDKIADQESAFSRALMLGDVLTLGRNVFGDKPNLSITDWIKTEDKAYDLLRNQPWRAPNATYANVNDPNQPPKLGSGPPPSDLFDKSRLKHTDRQIMSPIDVTLWNRAKWCGTLFAEVGGSPPFLGILFEDGQIGQTIFKSWQERWGEEDADNALRIAIITGVSARNPTHYAVTIGPNFNQLKKSEGKTFVFVSRINRMEPMSSDNLDRFLSAYHRYGRYFLFPAHRGSAGASPTCYFQLHLAKRQIEIRPAWQIAENDPDIMALKDDDDPIIPPNVTDPPVNKALEWIRVLRQKNRRGS